MGREGVPGLASQDELLFLQVPHKNIQEGDNSKVSKKEQTPPLLCCLYIWKVPKETMEYQIQILKQIND